MKIVPLASTTPGFRPGYVVFALPADQKRVTRLTVPKKALVPKLSVYLDGLGADVGQQVARGVIYDTGGILIATGEEVVVPAGQGPGWIDFPFVIEGPVAIEEGVQYDFGAIGGPASEVIRLYGAPETGATRENSDSYDDGPSNPFGAPTVVDFNISLFATYVTHTEVMRGRSEIELARLPFPGAQEALASDGVRPGAARHATCGWHGTSFDPERGSVAIVQGGGSLDDLVGERLKLTFRKRGRERSVYVYVNGFADLDPGEDLSVSRRSFIALAAPSDGTCPVKVEIA